MKNASNYGGPLVPRELFFLSRDPNLQSRDSDLLSRDSDLHSQDPDFVT